MDTMSIEAFGFQAMCLNEHEKQVFESLRNNRTYSELELSAWHQKYFPSKRRATRNERGVVSNSFSDPRAQSSSIVVIKPSDSAASNTVSDSRKQTPNRTLGGSASPQSITASRSCNKKDSQDCSKSNTEQKRSAFKRPGSASSSSSTVSIAFEQSQQLAYTKNATSHRESLLRYLSNASPEGNTMATKLKFLSYIERANTQSLPSSSADCSFDGGFPGNSSAPSSSKNATIFSSLVGMGSSSSRHGGAPAAAADGEVVKSPSCELQTDELLKVFSQIGTPQFVESDKKIMSQSLQQITREKEGFTLASEEAEQQRKSAATGDSSSSRGVSLTAGTDQQPRPSELEQHKCTASHFDLSFWKSKLDESKHGTCPGLSSQAGSTSELTGFSQYANYGNAFTTSNPSLFCRRTNN